MAFTSSLPEVDRISGLVAFQHGRDIGEDLAANFSITLGRIMRRMRRDDNLIQRQQRVVRRWWFLFESIDTGAGDMAAPDGISQCGLVDQPAARDVDHNS